MVIFQLVGCKREEEEKKSVVYKTEQVLANLNVRSA